MSRTARLLAIGAMLLCVTGQQPSTPQRDCGYDETTVESLTSEQSDDMRACLDIRGWTYDEEGN